jgi:hypothetical protein
VPGLRQHSRQDTCIVRCGVWGLCQPRCEQGTNKDQSKGGVRHHEGFNEIRTRSTREWTCKWGPLDLAPSKRHIAARPPVHPRARNYCCFIHEQY